MDFSSLDPKWAAELFHKETVEPSVTITLFSDSLRQKRFWQV